MGTWRDHCKPIIHKVLEDTKGKTEKEIKKALHDAYPYGQRNNHPYKIWCNEIRKQRGLDRKEQNPNQEELF